MIWSSQTEIHTARISLLHERDIAERAQRGVARLLRRHSTSDVVSGFLLQMIVDLPIQIL